MFQAKNPGPYKRTQTAALWQAKFYLPWQAAVPQLLVYRGDIKQLSTFINYDIAKVNIKMFAKTLPI